MNSADRRRARPPRRSLRLAPALGALAVATALTGCVSTEQKATWAHVQDARIIASQNPTIVRRPGDEVEVTRVALLHAGGRLAIAVDLRNATSRPVNDIPISVGLRRRNGRRVYLNRAGGLNYFKTHLAVIRARGSVTWVFTGRRRQPLAGRPFAVAGGPPGPAVTVARTIPGVRVALAKAPHPAGRGTVQVTVTNLSAIPQIELQLYALVGSPVRYSAAGSATVADLESGRTATTRISLVGRPRGALVRLEALPTLF